jgi:hypothetical protein
MPDAMGDTPNDQTCFNGGDIGGIGCGTGDVQCCVGSLCVEVAGSTVCAALCSAAADCASNCCVALTNGSASICAGSSNCQPIQPSDPPPTEPFPTTAPLPAETYNLSRIDRVGSNIYKADSGGTALVIETRICLALTLRNDGLLLKGDDGSYQMFIDNGSGDVCDVADIYVSTTSFGTFDVFGLQSVVTDMFRAQSGLANLFIETQFCYEYPAYDDGVLLWQGVGSQLIIQGLSDAVCDVVNVYSN